jgi:hypothetical protein
MKIAIRVDASLQIGTALVLATDLGDTASNIGQTP